MFPLDPTPFVFAYVIAVFIFPWAVFCSYLIREWNYLKQKKVVGWLWVHPRQWSKIWEFRNTDPRSKYLFGKVKQWMFITFVAWVVGFVILGVTLYLLDANDLLINHSKGIYDPRKQR